MVRVCTDTLINEKNPDRNGFYMDDILKENLDALIKNVKNDWDFNIIISGGGRVRIGKSLLALQIAYYWKHELKRVHKIDVPFTIENNIVFKGSELIIKGNYLGEHHPFSPLIFDEAGADLEGAKTMRRTTQDVKDFLRECGQYNLLTILVLPEYFDLPKGIAMSRSDCLLDVFTIPNKEGIFERGFFNFFSRHNKKYLYMNGKKELNYKAYPYDFHGRFYNNYPISEEEYRKAKFSALKEREMDEKKIKYTYQRNILCRILSENGWSHQKISDKLREYGINISEESIGIGILTTKEEKFKRIMYKNEDDGGEEGEDED